MTHNNKGMSGLHAVELTALSVPEDHRKRFQAVLDQQQLERVAETENAGGKVERGRVRSPLLAAAAAAAAAAGSDQSSSNSIPSALPHSPRTMNDVGDLRRTARSRDVHEHASTPPHSPRTTHDVVRNWRLATINTARARDVYEHAFIEKPCGARAAHNRSTIAAINAAGRASQARSFVDVPASQQHSSASASASAAAHADEMHVDNTNSLSKTGDGGAEPSRAAKDHNGYPIGCMEFLPQTKMPEMISIADYTDYHRFDLTATTSGLQLNQAFVNNDDI